MRSWVGDTRLESNVRRHDRRVRRGGHLEVGRVGEAADVVTDAGADVKTRLRHRRAPRVDAERNVEANRQLTQYRHHAIELFFFADRVTGSGLHSPDVQDVRSLGDELLGACEERVEVVGRGRFVK